MTLPLNAMHRLAIDAEGATTTSHPDQDVPDCGFDAYVERDWTGQNVVRPSSWEFVRSADLAGVVWSGTRVDGPKLPDAVPACGVLDVFDPAKPCTDSPNRPAPCLCWHTTGHDGDHGCRCRNAWPAVA